MMICSPHLRQMISWGMAHSSLVVQQESDPQVLLDPPGPHNNQGGETQEDQPADVCSLLRAGTGLVVVSLIHFINHPIPAPTMMASITKAGVPWSSA